MNGANDGSPLAGKVLEQVENLGTWMTVQATVWMWNIGKLEKGLNLLKFIVFSL